MNKQVMINIPDTMNDKTAQSVFMTGLQATLGVFNGGVVVMYGVNSGVEQGIKNYVLQGLEASAVIQFIESMKEINTIESLEKSGNSILNDMPKT